MLNPARNPDLQALMANGGLQPLQWPELVAKLAAIREIRSISADCQARDIAGDTARDSASDSGSFARFTAGVCESVKENGVSVNLDALADRKCSGSKEGEEADGNRQTVNNNTLGVRE